jgi:tetratricopeptide (TPR) repeat protein
MKQKVVVYSVHLLSLLVLIKLVSLSLNYFLQTRNSLEKLNLAIKIAPGEARNYFYIGLLKHYSIPERDITEAISYYREALKRLPLYPNAWYALANAYQETGELDDALKAIKSYSLLNPKNPEVLWRTGLFYLISGADINRANHYFRQYIQLVPHYQTKVYELYHQLGIPNEFIIKNLISGHSELYNTYLLYLVRENRLKDALKSLNIVNHSLLKENTKLRLCDFFIQKGEYREALLLWGEISSETERSLITNGGFENNIRNGCFGWRVGRAKGVEIYLDKIHFLDGTRSLSVSFGGENVGITIIRQIVPVEPDTEYTLKANIKTEGITTTNGVFLELRGYRCKGLYSRSDVFTGTNPWTPVSIKFTVPEECYTIQVAFKRERSFKFNNRIKGKAWIDRVELIKTGD